MSKIEHTLKEEAKKLFNEGKVDLIIGYQNGTLPFRATPCFIRKVEEVKNLIFNECCHNSLVGYLRGRKERIGIVVKGCDGRNLVNLIKEKQVNREKIVIIGVPCYGVIDRKKVELFLKGKEILEAVVEDRKILLKGETIDQSLNTEDFLADNCVVCQHKTPPLSDVVIEERREEKEEGVENPFFQIEEIEKKDPAQRWQYFNQEVEKCLRCYACRQACPLCYCPDCFVDQNFPHWFGKSLNLSDTMCFHLIRAFHTTGRCVDCGACEQACPMEVNLRSLTKKIEKEVKGLFGEEAGLSLDQPSALVNYQEKDPEEFIK